MVQCSHEEQKMAHTCALSDAEAYLLKTLGLKIRTAPLLGVSLLN